MFVAQYLMKKQILGNAGLEDVMSGTKIGEHVVENAEHQNQKKNINSSNANKLRRGLNQYKIEILVISLKKFKSFYYEKNYYFFFFYIYNYFLWV